MEKCCVQNWLAISFCHKQIVWFNFPFESIFWVQFIDQNFRIVYFLFVDKQHFDTQLVLFSTHSKWNAFCFSHFSFVLFICDFGCVFLLFTMKFSCRLPLNTSRVYHFILYLLGIRIKLFDFSSFENDRKSPNSFKKRIFKWVSAIVFIIFLIIYPIFISNVLSYSPVFGNQKRIEYFVATLNLYIKFVALVSIFILELVRESQAIAFQNVVKRDLIQLEHVYSNWFLHLNRRTFKSKNWNESLIKLTDLKCGRGLIIVFIMIVYNVLLSFVVVNNFEIKISKSYEAIVTFIPNFCITVFIWHLSELSVQYKKMFQCLDQIIEVIANDICKQLSMRTKKNNRFKYFVVATMNEHKLNTAINDLAATMECHNNLKTNVLHIRNLYSLQTNTVILSDFVSIIIEVRRTFQRAFQMTIESYFDFILCYFPVFYCLWKIIRI